MCKCFSNILFSVAESKELLNDSFHWFLYSDNLGRVATNVLTKVIRYKLCKATTL